MDLSESYAQRVADYYNATPHREWDRFARHPFEYPVTMHFLRKHIQPGHKVLDVGGGPGHYSLALTADGCSVDLFDLSENLVELASEKAKEQNLQLAGLHVGTATDLGRFEDESFDVVLCMGPLYHLVDSPSRSQAVSESLRVLKPDGVLAVSFISVLGRLFHVLRNNPGGVSDELDFLVDVVTADQEFQLVDSDFTDAWLVQPDSVVPMMSAYSLRQLELVGVEGPMSQSETAIVEAGPDAVAGWVDLAIRTASNNASLYGSDHLLYMGKKV